MKRHAFLFILILLFCICFIFQPSSVQAQDTQHQLNMYLSPEVATPGTPFSWEFDIVPGSISGNVDIYALILPAVGPLLFFNSYGLSDQAVPYEIDATVLSESSSFFSDLVLPGGLPQGDYLFGALLVNSLTNPYDTTNWVSNLPVSSLYFSVLSPPQEVFINELGYPQQFIKTFSDDNGKVRVDETWIYIQQGLRVFFIDGVFIKEESIDTTDITVQPSEYHPEDYTFDMTAQGIIAINGQPQEIKEGPIWSGAFFDVFQTNKHYIYDGIIFGFNNEKLVFVIPPQ